MEKIISLTNWISKSVSILILILLVLVVAPMIWKMATEPLLYISDTDNMPVNAYFFLSTAAIFYNLRKYRTKLMGITLLLAEISFAMFIISIMSVLNNEFDIAFEYLQSTGNDQVKSTIYSLAAATDHANNIGFFGIIIEASTMARDIWFIYVGFMFLYIARFIKFFRDIGMISVRDAQ